MTDNLPPNEYREPPDLVALLRDYQPPDGERGQFSISSCPKYITWIVESLCDRAGGSQPRAYSFLLERGMRDIWKFPGTRDLQRAREVIVARGDRDEMRWIDTWDFDVPTADTGETIHQVRLPVEGILTPLGNLKKVLGFTKSRTAVLALAVALLDDTEVRMCYHLAQVDLLRKFAAKLRAHAERATEIAAKESDPDGTTTPRYSLDDIIGVRV